MTPLVRFHKVALKLLKPEVPKEKSRTRKQKCLQVPPGPSPTYRNTENRCSPCSPALTWGAFHQ